MVRSGFRVAAIAMALCGSVVAQACCSVSAEQEWVRFGRQTNIIVWDSKARIEHFVRNATFETNGKDFGFIAPTPTVPEIVEVDPQAFDTLSALEPTHGDLAAGGMDSAASDGAGSAPEVVQTIDVAGYRATTLKASDSIGLAKWLKKNGYRTSPDVEEWTRHYIAKGWYLTAFKVLKNGGRAETGTVRMSFKAKRPFNPYYVPKSNAAGERTRPGLQVFFVSDADLAPDHFLGGPKWTADVPTGSKELLRSQLRLDTLPSSMRVSSFFDANFPNPEDMSDVYFNPAPFGWRFGSSSARVLATVCGALLLLAAWRLASARKRPTLVS